MALRECCCNSSIFRFDTCEQDEEKDPKMRDDLKNFARRQLDQKGNGWPQESRRRRQPDSRGKLTNGCRLSKSFSPFAKQPGDEQEDQEFENDLQWNLLISPMEKASE